MVNWDADDVQEFKKVARMAQQEYCDLLGDREWDVLKCYEWSVFASKVGFGIFGPPGSTPTFKNYNTGYNEDQLNVIKKICNQLEENLNFGKRDIHFACIFVIMKVFDKRYTVPVFKAKRESDSSSECVYVDTDARKYKSWDDYLNNNTLQKCIYCYPAYGLYEYDSDNEVRVKFGTSPACDLVSRIFRIFDRASTVVTVAGAGVGIAALCAVPIAGPVMAATAVAGASSSAYGITRSSYALYDRATHSQSISLGDSDARGCWLSIIGSSLGFAEGRIASMAKAGVMGKAGRIAFLVIRTGRLTVSGIGIVHGLAVLIDKFEKNELTPLAVFQFSSSVLFFTNIKISALAVETIIREVRSDLIRARREGLSDDINMFFKKQTEKKMLMKAVKQLIVIENSKDLYEMLSDESSSCTSCVVKLTKERPEDDKKSNI